jgi:hypothetical protein
MSKAKAKPDKATKAAPAAGPAEQVELKWGDAATRRHLWRQEVLSCSPESWTKLKAADSSLSTWAEIRFSGNIVAVSPFSFIDMPKVAVDVASKQEVIERPD